MSNTIHANNMHDLLDKIAPLFEEKGYSKKSRNGDVLRLPGVTTCHIENPMQNVCFIEERDANPFFHLVEAMAMLVPVNSVVLLSFFASNMRNFSDNGEDFNAFYGTRAFCIWGNQIEAVIDILNSEPDSRQAVVNLWDPSDLEKETRDKACNLLMIFSIDGNKLNMTTFNRSNDAVWGFVTGANMVHFPYFQEYVAKSLDLEVGYWAHSSANMHVYAWNDKWPAMVKAIKEKSGQKRDLYAADGVKHYPIFESRKHRRTFQIELDSVLFEMQSRVNDFEMDTLDTERTYLDRTLRTTPFIRDTLVPAFNAFMCYKLSRKTCNKLTEQSLSKAMGYLCQMPYNSDWRQAMISWIQKRLMKPQP